MAHPVVCHRWNRGFSPPTSPSSTTAPRPAYLWTGTVRSLWITGTTVQPGGVLGHRGSNLSQCTAQFNNQKCFRNPLIFILLSPMTCLSTCQVEVSIPIIRRGSVPVVLCCGLAHQSEKPPHFVHCAFGGEKLVCIIICNECPANKAHGRWDSWDPPPLLLHLGY